MENFYILLNTILFYRLVRLLSSEPETFGSIVRRVLLNTRLFREPPKDLGGLIDLWSSGLEAFILASYASDYAVYFSENQDYLILPVSEYDLWINHERQWRGEAEKIMQPFKLISFQDYSYYFERGHGYEKFYLNPEISKKLVRHLLNEDKYIILAPYSQYMQRRKEWIRSVIAGVYEEIIEYDISPYDVLLIPFETYDPGCETSFDEYLSGVVLRQKGYIVSTSLIGLWPGSTGADIHGFSFIELKEGAFLIELLLGKRLKEGRGEASACIVEVEAKNRVLDKKHGLNQLIGYMYDRYGCYGKGFVAASFMEDYQIEEILKNDYGVITYDADGNIIFEDSQIHSDEEKEWENLKSAGKWINYAIESFVFSFAR